MAYNLKITSNDPKRKSMAKNLPGHHIDTYDLFIMILIIRELFYAKPIGTLTG